MAKFRLGCVPYVNARPLVDWFDLPESDVEMRYDVPSRLPHLLEIDAVDAILVSSIEFIRRTDLEIVSELGIMSDGPVASVRLLSKVPIGEIKSLTLDQSSMTSNLLAQVILAESGVFPKTSVCVPDISLMLDQNDACVIIGDLGMQADGTGLFDIDLGAAWTELTGLPFVWALWLCKKSFGEKQSLANLLQAAYQASEVESFHGGEYTGIALSTAEKAATRAGWSLEQTIKYFTENVQYTDPTGQGLQAFKHYLEKHHLLLKPLLRS